MTKEKQMYYLGYDYNKVKYAPLTITGVIDTDV